MQYDARIRALGLAWYLYRVFGKLQLPRFEALNQAIVAKVLLTAWV